MSYTRFPARTRGGILAPQPQPDPAAAAAIPSSFPETAAAPPRATPAAEAADKKSRRLGLMVVLFLLAAFTPLQFALGGLALSPARVVMVLVTIPVFIAYASGRAGGVHRADIFAFLYVVWYAISMFVFGGTSMTEFVGISTIEILTPYLLARCMIRTRAQYNAFLRLAMVLVGIMLVTAAIESTTGRSVINSLFSAVGRVYPVLPDQYDLRLGLIRAKTVFPHPILYGLVMSLFLATLIYLPRSARTPPAWMRGGGVLAATFFSLSTGAWLGTTVQIGLMVWDKVLRTFKERWTVLIWLSIFGYIAIDVLSDRTPFEVFISYATLNPGTSYWRVLIFVHGIDDVLASPFFGIGMGDWTRPEWMYSSSVDNYWLVVALRHGIPGFLLFAAMYLSILIGVARVPIRNEGLRLQRNAFVYVMVGLVMSLATVYVWSTAFYIMMFVMGSMSWIYTSDETGAPEGPEGHGPAARAGRQGPQPPARS